MSHLILNYRCEYYTSNPYRPLTPLELPIITSLKASQVLVTTSVPIQLPEARSFTNCRLLASSVRSSK
jgi:hypothetical protein